MPSSTIMGGAIAAPGCEDVNASKGIGVAKFDSDVGLDFKRLIEKKTTTIINNLVFKYVFKV